MHLLQHVPRHATGHIIISYRDVEGFDTPPPVEADTLQCQHCQFNWIVRPGSGTKRGWCFRCSGPTCGKELCEKHCVPWERMLEMAEASRSLEAAMARVRAM